MDCGARRAGPCRGATGQLNGVRFPASHVNKCRKMKDHELPTLALQAIRKSLPIDAWSKFADVIANDRRKRQPHLVKPEVDRSWFGAIESLKKNGFVKLPNRLPAETIQDIRRYLDAE